MTAGGEVDGNNGEGTGTGGGWRDPVVLAILLLCLLPEILLSGADLGLWGDGSWRRRAIALGGFWPGLLQGGPPLYPLQPVAMFATYGFLHAGALHFLVNMVTLASLGPAVVERFDPGPPPAAPPSPAPPVPGLSGRRMGGTMASGRGRLALLWLLSTFGGALGYALLAPGLQPMVGASGALFGLVGALVALNWRGLRRRNAPVGPVWRAVLGLAALNLVLWWAMQGQLAWETHLGGFLAGWFAGLALEPPDRRAG